MTADSERPTRVAEVLAAISGVRDPEIDEEVGTLGFELNAEVNQAGQVTVSLRLPTFWCPANFAFLIAQDMRRAVEALPWVTGFRLRLLDHFAAEDIGRSVSEGFGFEAAFPLHASGDLARLRRDFDEKAFLKRQGELATVLHRHGWSAAELSALTIESAQTISEPDVAPLLAAYLEKRIAIDLGPSGPVLATTDGKPIAPEDVPAHMRMIRFTIQSACANGEMCRMLAAARAGLETTS